MLEVLYPSAVDILRRHASPVKSGLPAVDLCDSATILSPMGGALSSLSSVGAESGKRIERQSILDTCRLSTMPKVTGAADSTACHRAQEPRCAVMLSRGRYAARLTAATGGPGIPGAGHPAQSIRQHIYAPAERDKRNGSHLGNVRETGVRLLMLFLAYFGLKWPWDVLGRVPPEIA